MSDIIELRRVWQEARARASRALTDLELAETARNVAERHVVDWQRRHNETRRPRFLASGSARAEGGLNAEVPVEAPPEPEFIDRLRESLAAAEKAEAEAREALQGVEAMPIEVDRSTGWAAGRVFKYEGRQYQVGEAIDPEDIDPTKWSRLVGSRHIRPTGRVGVDA